MTSHLPQADLLKEIRVLDLTNVLSGPFCTYQLGLLGAEVIKIENPRGGDLARELGASAELNQCQMGASFLAQNAGKKSVTLNLKSEEGRALFLRLVETADVVVENFRPGVMKRLGVDYSALRVIRPSLVYCAISGFGQEGPLRENPAYDQIIQGMSGVMSITGDESSAPLRVGYPLCDTLGGITAAFAIASALVDARSSGRGREIDVSMLDSTLVALGWTVSNYLLAGVTPKPLGNENMTAAPSGTFRTGDGLLNIAANRQQQFQTLCQLIGRPDLTEDPRFRDREQRKANRASLTAELEAELAKRGAPEWEKAFNEAGVPAGRVLTIPEVLSHPQVAQRELVQTLDCDVTGQESLSVMRAGFRLSDCTPAAGTPPPALGAHTQDVLGAIGLSESAIAAYREAGVI